MKMQKSALFAAKMLRINMLKIQIIVKLEIIVIVQVNLKVLHVASVI